MICVYDAHFMKYSCERLIKALEFDCERNQFRLQLTLEHRLIEHFVNRVEDVCLTSMLKDDDFYDASVRTMVVNQLARFDYELKTLDIYTGHFERVKRRAIAEHALTQLDDGVIVEQRILSSL